MSNLFDDLNRICGGGEQPTNQPNYEVGNVIKVSPSVFGIRGSQS